MNIAFLASNNGSSLRAVVAAIEAGALDARPVLVVSNRKAAPALAFAAEHGVAAAWIPTTPDPDGADRRVDRHRRDRTASHCQRHGRNRGPDRGNGGWWRAHRGRWLG